MPTQVKGAGALAWDEAFAQWLKPFLAALPRCTHRKWAPRYVEGLLGPAERKSIERIADRVAAGDYDQLHHFVTTAAWDVDALLPVLAEQAQAMVGGPEAVLIVDDTSICKQGTHSVGVARQYSGVVGTVANCQTLVSLTLAEREVPLPIALRLYLPRQWASDPRRCRAAGVPSAECVYKPKWQLALEELDRVRAAGVTFGLVLADSGYGMCPEFRRGLSARGLTWAVGIPVTLQVYPAAVRLTWRRQRGGRRRRPRPLTKPRLVRAFREAALCWHRLTWRRGTKGQLRAQFAAARVRIGDGPKLPSGWKVPSEELWLVGERRPDGAERYYLTNLPAAATLRQLAAAIKARWVCEQAHQQMKEELGLDHFEGRSWAGLHHHVVLTMIAFAFLQHYRLSHQRPVAARGVAPAGAAREKNPRATTRPQSPRDPPSVPRRRAHAALPTRMPALRYHHQSRAA
jgi:SRSO17 transposase